MWDSAAPEALPLGCLLITSLAPAHCRSQAWRKSLHNAVEHGRKERNDKTLHEAIVHEGKKQEKDYECRKLKEIQWDTFFAVLHALIMGNFFPKLNKHSKRI